MRPNPQAAKQATLGLALLSQDTGDYSQTPAAVLARKIQNREPLNELEVSKIREFHRRPHEATASWVMASQLYGGQPLLDQITAVPEKPEEPKATISVGLREDAQAILQKQSDYPCDRIELAEIGHPGVLSQLEKLQAKEVCETLSETLPPIGVDAKWQTEAITASGYETNVTFSHPDLYLLKHQLDATMNRYEVPYSDAKPWQPAVTAAMSPVEQEQIFAPFTAVADRIILDWGGEETVYYFTGSKVAAVTASDAPEPTLDNVIGRTGRMLRELDERWLTQIEAVVRMAVNQALEKVGRSIRKNAPEEFATVTASLAPTLVSVTAAMDVLEGINVNQLIAAPIDDAVTQAEELTAQHLQAVQALIGQQLALDINLRSRYTRELNRATQLLRNRLKDWIQWRLCTPQGEEKLENLSSVIDPPTTIVRDFAQVAGGDTTTKDDEGLFRPDNEGNVLPALAVGAVGAGILRRAFDFHKSGNSTQIALSEAPAIADTEVAALAALSPDDSVEFIERYEWTPNYYGTIKTEHHPRHKPHFGDIVDDPRSVSGDRPGDHPHCRCGWNPIFNVDLGPSEDS